MNIVKSEVKHCKTCCLAKNTFMCYAPSPLCSGNIFLITYVFHPYCPSFFLSKRIWVKLPDREIDRSKSRPLTQDDCLLHASLSPCERLLKIPWIRGLVHRSSKNARFEIKFGRIIERGKLNHIKLH